MIKPKFEIGDGYKTRDGRDAGIYWIGKLSIHGWISDEFERDSAEWFRGGNRCSNPSCCHGDDIMPKPEPLMEFWDVYNSGGINVARGKDLDEMQRRFSGCKIVHMREVRDE
jgi:hypothetical protein